MLVYYSIFVLARNGYGYGSLIDLTKVRFFIVKQSMKLSPKLHTNIKELQPLKWTLICYHDSYGNTTVTNRIVIRDSHYTELANIEQITTLVDLATRRPIRIPDYIREQQTHSTKDSEESYMPLELSLPRKLSPPLDSFKTNFKVNYSQTDSNNHLNHIEFYHLLVDAITEAAVSKYLRFFDSDILLYPTREVQISYGKESSAGDVIEAQVWQHTTLDAIIYVAFTCQNGTVATCIVELDGHKGQSYVHIPSAVSKKISNL